MCAAPDGDVLSNVDLSVPDPAIHEVEVPDALADERVDRVVSLVADVSRNLAAVLISDGMVQINGDVPLKPSIKLQSGDQLKVTVPFRDTTIKPDASVDVTIRYVDDHVIVVDKPAGLIVHPGSGVDDGTLIQGLLALYPEIISVGDDGSRPGVVHRLDKGTSGLLMVARTALAFKSLTGQLAARTVLRRYQTLAWGDVESARGVIDARLGRSPHDATRQAVVADGREARTHYEVLARYEDPALTLLHCRLETGRTHQIRVHLEAISSPVVGDDRYGGGSRRRLGLTRPFLHAELLGFVHPESGEWLEFESELPEELTTLLAGLGPAID